MHRSTRMATQMVKKHLLIMNNSTKFRKFEQILSLKFCEEMKIFAIRLFTIGNDIYILFQ